MKVRLKICGMRQPDNIREVAELLPDYMGFIFYNQSPRYVGDDFTIPNDLPSSINRVGVFVNENAQSILDKCIQHDLRFVQLHGLEEPALCAELKATGLLVIKVFSVDDEFDFSEVEPFKKVVDYFMFDTKGLLYGGNAKPFNWSLLEKYDQKIPFFLSGGISPTNVNEAISLNHINLHALDVNSGVEAQPGLKDLNKIDLLLKNLKA